VAFKTAPGDSSGKPRSTPWNEESMSMTNSMSCIEGECVVEAALVTPCLSRPKVGWAAFELALLANKKFMVKVNKSTEREDYDGTS
jgi:hypothetical protein